MTAFWIRLSIAARELWGDFVNTANPRVLNEGIDEPAQPLHSDTRYECIDYHNPFPSIYLDHVRRSRGQLPRPRSGDGLSASIVDNHHETPNDSLSMDEDDRSAFTNTRDTMVHSMRQMVKEVRSLTTTRKGNVILRWLLHVVIAISVACIAFCMIYTTDYLYEWRYVVLHRITKEKFESSPALGYFTGWLFWISSSAVLLSLAAAAIVFEPAASGSGLPDVISFLNGVMRPKVVNLKTFIAKAVSCVCSVAGGFPAGMEAPLVHIGAIVGTGVTQGRSRTLNCKTPLFQTLRTNKDRRDFITAGAACGVAAAFGAPIGGLLFIMEEVASFWDHNNSGQVFLATMSCFTMIAFLNSLLNDLPHTAYVLFEVDVRIPLNITAIIPAMFLGLICGLLSAVFTKVNLMVTKWRRRVIRPHPLKKFLEPICIAAVYVSLSYVFALISPCYKTEVGMEDDNEVHWHTENLTVLSDIGCPSNKFTPLGTLTLKTSKETVRHLFTRQTVDQFPAGVLIFFFLLYFCMSVYASGSAVATGLVIPMLVNGATVGRLFGLILVKGFSSIGGSGYTYDQQWMDPGVYALIGAGAFFSGCTRMMLSICVIMVELAGDLHYLLPTMVAIVIAKNTADYLAKPIYHAQLHLDHVPFLPSHWDESMMEAYTAADVMSSDVVTLREREYTSVVLAILKASQHHAFPVVRPIEGGGEKFVGMVTREDIQVYLAIPELQMPNTSVAPSIDIENNLRRRHTPEDRASVHEHSPNTPNSPELSPENLPPCVREVSKMSWSQWVTHQSSLFLRMGDRKWHEEWDHRLASGASGEGISTLPPVVDLSLIVNRSPYVVPPFFNLSLTYHMFRSVGLRHLVVLDGQTVVGIITRKDLLHFTDKDLRQGSTVDFTVDSNVRTRSRRNSVTHDDCQQSHSERRQTEATY